MRETSTCTYCGKQHPPSKLHELGEARLCPACLQAHTLVCQDCGERIWKNDNSGSDELPLCRSCYEQNYTRCVRCGTVLRESNALYESSDDDEEYPYCDPCFYALDRKGIHDYYYKPAPLFYGDGPRYFGVELEIDGGGESVSNAKRLLEIGNSDRALIYCKHDGSLEEGMEIVTHPMSLDFHLREMPWEALMRAAVELGYTSHQAHTCGLHVHVNRNAFGKMVAEQDACIARILYFFEKHWEELLKFSRRTQRQLDQWAARYGYREHPMEILDHAKSGAHAGRYTCVNLTNYETIEFRMFRGTLRPNTLLATLQLVDRVCEAALSMSDYEIKAMSWTTFVSGCTAPELVRYLKERRLYVNEPVAMEAEM